MTPAERCGRRAAELLDDGDVVLALPHHGDALATLLDTMGGDTIRVLVPLVPAAVSTRLFERAVAAGVPAMHVDATALEHARATLVLAEAVAVGSDGSVVLSAEARRLADSAEQAPLYVLAPDGPHPHAIVDALDDMLAPERVSAIVTSRGIYRPAMVVRHLSDGDAPLDVIPLV